MHKQKEHDECQPLMERVGIGGIIQILSMDKQGYTLLNYQKFDDYEELHGQMLDNLTK